MYLHKAELRENKIIRVVPFSNVVKAAKRIQHNNLILRLHNYKWASCSIGIYIYQQVYSWYQTEHCYTMQWSPAYKELAKKLYLGEKNWSFTGIQPTEVHAPT